MVVIVAVIIIVWMAMITPYAMITNSLLNDSKYSSYITEETCIRSQGVWDGGVCQATTNRGKEIISGNRKFWLLVPFILILFIMIWGISKALSHDTMENQRRW